GDSAGSKLIQLVSGTGKIAMPPAGNRLTAEQVGILRAWVDQGMKWPESATVKNTVATPAASHWSFVAPARRDVQTVRNREWARNRIDAVVLARVEAGGIAPSPEADRRTLIRRVSLDLIGLPPTPEEVREFVSDKRPDAYERLVDRLLASPHYGEKWARNWL